jgi:hexosaminidase
MPGHSSSALAAYPQYGNVDVPGYHPQVATKWGVHPYTYAPTEETFGFLEAVLSEVARLFPSSYIHIGGDEAPKDQWRESARAQAVMKANGIKTEDELQSWFVQRIERILSSLDRKLIGWDEIQEGGLSPTATMMVWRSWDWAAHALARGNKVIMSPVTHCYFDYYQGPPATEPPAMGGDLPLETVYGFEPIPSDLRQYEQQVLGVQGNVWTEGIADVPSLEYMTFPRACAMAEVAWSDPKDKDYGDFIRRLRPLLATLRSMDVNHRAV